MKAAVAIYARTIRTEPELLFDLRQIVEDGGAAVVGTYLDDARIEGKGKRTAWRRLLAVVDQIDRICLSDVGHLPGRNAQDILAILATLTTHGVSIAAPFLNIDTGSGPAAVLDLIASYRRAKKSEAIRRGQKRAHAAGKHIGRPPIPATVRQHILADLRADAGVRSTARRFAVSAGSVSAIKKSMIVDLDRLVA